MHIKQCIIFQNTIYDDEYEPLQVPARIPVGALPPSHGRLCLTSLVSQRTAEEEAEERLMFLGLVERIARIQRVLKVMPVSARLTAVAGHHLTSPQSFFDGLKRGAQESRLPCNHLTIA
jgi:hypothetical protein